jgi:predicted esterase
VDRRVDPLIVQRARHILLLALTLAARSVVAEPPRPTPPKQAKIDESPTPAQVVAQRKRLHAARQTLEGIEPSKKRGVAVARLALGHELGRLDALLRQRRPVCNPEPEVRRLERDLQLLAGGQLPHEAPGVHRLAYRSALDRRVHAFAVYVPSSYAAGRRLPLVVMLHGMGSNPMRGLGRLFGIADRDLRDSQVTCDRPPLKGPEALVVAPHGFGDALYRVVGEVDVRDVLRTVMPLYRVDAGRVTITGLSMGGTGAAEIALQHPATYAGVLALCGYFDRRQDSVVQGQPLLPWEKHLMSVHSPVDWAVNGRGMPLLLVHGTEDGPGRARRMKEKYEALGYKVELELHERGHDVWVPGYKDQRAFAQLIKLRHVGAPKLVTFATGRPRINRAHWVTIERFVDHGAWAEVRAEAQGRTALRVQTKNVAVLRLDLPAAHLARGAAVALTIDGTTLQAPAGGRKGPRRLRLQRAKGRWQLADEEPKEERTAAIVKRPGLSGPIEDLYFDPLIVVYGTGRGQAARLRSVAKKIAAYRKRVTLSYPVLSDTQLTAAAARKSALILVGNEENNGVLARLGPRLPLRVKGSEVLLGGKSYRRPDIGATFIYPNPEAPDRYLRVVGGTSARSYELYDALPVYLPDYAIFDEGMASKRPLPILGAKRSLVAGGSFDERWQLGAPPLSVSAKSPASKGAPKKKND